MPSIRLDNVDKLNGKNFNKWRLQISLILEANDLWDVVTGEEVKPSGESATAAAAIKAWKKKDVQARSIIAPTLDDIQTTHVYSCTSAKEMFDKLKNANSDSGSFNKQ